MIQNGTIENANYDVVKREEAYNFKKILQILGERTLRGMIDTYINKTNNIMETWNEPTKVFKEIVDAKITIV